MPGQQIGVSQYTGSVFFIEHADSGGHLRTHFFRLHDSVFYRWDADNDQLQGAILLRLSANAYFSPLNIWLPQQLLERKWYYCPEDGRGGGLLVPTGTNKGFNLTQLKKGFDTAANIALVQQRALRAAGVRSGSQTPPARKRLTTNPPGASQKPLSAGRFSISHPRV